MAEKKRRSGPEISGKDRQRAEDDAERALGRWFALGLPLATGVGALVVGSVASVGSAFLVLAAGALLGAIGLLWTSLRTLSGDAPLPTDMREIATLRSDVDALAEHKRRALRALKDLENEHALGRIDDADYEAVVHRYREEAKALMRRMDDQAAPGRSEAERLATEYVERHRTGGVEVSSDASSNPGNRAEKKTGRGKGRGSQEGTGARRILCAKCEASNEPDATFCKQCGTAMVSTKEVNDAAT